MGNIASKKITPAADRIPPTSHMLIIVLKAKHNPMQSQYLFYHTMLPGGIRKEPAPKLALPHSPKIPVRVPTDLQINYLVVQAAE